MSGVILITGGGLGIGAATDRLADESGLDVAVNFRSDRVAAQATVDAITEAGLRDTVKVIIGGAPVNQAFATQIGADGYAADAGSATRLAKELLA